MECEVATCHQVAIGTVIAPIPIEVCREHFDEWRDGDEMPRWLVKLTITKAKVMTGGRDG